MCLLAMLLASQAAEPAPAEAEDTAAAVEQVAVEAAEETGDTGDHFVPELQDPFPFNHKAHAKAFNRVKVACSDCHPIGLTTKEKGSYTWPGDEIPHPRSNCHACHRHEVDGAPRSARGLCLQCHANPEEIMPDTHDQGWMTSHGLAARTPGNNCEDCHTSSRCISCHDDRGPLTDNPHGPGFSAWHGIEARMDPRKCSTCHTTSSCTTCHETGSMPW